MRGILLAQNLISEEDIPEADSAMDDISNREWSISLAKIFREHWDEQKRISEEYINELDKEKAKEEQAIKDESLKPSDDAAKAPQDLDEIIACAEKQNREIRQNDPDIKKESDVYMPVYVPKQ